MAFATTDMRARIDAIGGSAKASANRELLSYTYVAMKTCMPEMVEVLIDSVFKPDLLYWEIDEQIFRLKAELAKSSSNPEKFLLDALHAVAYTGGLGIPLIPSEHSVSRLRADYLNFFRAANFLPPRIVLAASGVVHDDLVSIAEPLLSGIPVHFGQATTPNVVSRPKSTYIGGEYRRSSYSLNTDVALAFEVPGGWLKEKDSVTVSVLQILLGGRQGKGLHSRLYRLGNEFDQIKSISAFKDVHSNTGIFGIYTSTVGSFVPKAIDLAARELTSLATPGQVDQRLLDRAKSSAKSVILANLKSQASITEDMGRQVLAFGKRKPHEHLLKAIDGVTLKDIVTICEKIISSPLTMASYGNVQNMPTYESVASSAQNE